MEKVKAFLKVNDVLLVEANPIARAYIQKVLVEIGADPGRIFAARDHAEAIELILLRRPRVVVCDDSIGLEKVIEVAHHQRSALESTRDSIFFYLSGNSSQAVIGRAAEEELDGFILKPFTRTEFIRVFNWIIQEKLNPTDYQKELHLGRDLLFGGSVDAAIAHFEKARGMNENPAMAHFYLGQAQEMKKLLLAAQAEFKSGVKLNQVHCRCLLGMFDLLMAENRMEESYEVLRRIVSLFPANPQRLSTALNLAVKTGNFRDVENYYDFYSAMDEENRTPELKNHMCSALAVNGKFHLIRSSKENAVIAFERAATQGEGQEKFLDYIMETLLRYGLTEEAAAFSARFRKRNDSAKKAA